MSSMLTGVVLLTKGADLEAYFRLAVQNMIDENVFDYRNKTLAIIPLSS